MRNDEGDLVINANGFPDPDPQQGVVGDPIPDWIAGIGNTFRYKDFSLSVLFDIREGGDVWCGTCGILDFFGTSDRTLAREDVVVFPGVIRGTNTPNTQAVQLYDVSQGDNSNYWRRYGFGGLSESSIYDASWVRLREVTLKYSLPRKLMRNTFLEDVSVSLFGRNLWLSTDYPGIDPETNLTGDSNGIGLDYFNQPNTKSYGLNFSLTF